MRAPIHYSLAIAIMVVYGVQVCPFLESLTPLQLAGPLVAGLALQGLARRPARKIWVLDAPFELRARRALTVDMSLFLVAGMGVTAYNTIVYGFPIGSGLKVILGFMTLGFFIAIDLALEMERKMARQLKESRSSIALDTSYFPVSRKLGLFATASAIMITAIFFLVVSKDLDWLKNIGDTVSLHEAQRAILIEFAFVSTVMLGYVLNVIRSYTGNLKLFFETETTVLERANQGDLEGWVPVSSNDEFGVMAHHTNLMVDAIRERTKEIQRTRDVTILSLATLAETRDNETGAHILRTQRYVKALAEQMATQPKFADALDPGTIELLYKSAPLHDVGKVGIPDAILLKPDKLTDEEFSIMKTHAGLGADAIKTAEDRFGESSSFLRHAREIAETHHEKWDGSGYPKGLKGEGIPLSGRLMALADVYDALISERVYKPAFHHDVAKDIILDGKGKHFDPDVIEAFIAVEDEFVAIAAEFGDASYGHEAA